MIRRQADILKAIESIHSEKQERSTLPDYATTIEIARRTGIPLSEVTDTVHGLAESGVLHVGPTFNYEYCEIIDNNWHIA